MDNNDKKKLVDLIESGPFYVNVSVVDGQYVMVSGFDNDMIPVMQESYEMQPATGSDRYIGGDHYSKLAIEPVEFIVQNDLGFLVGNIIKYISRYQYKNGIEDMKKAIWYIKEYINSVVPKDNIGNEHVEDTLYAANRYIVSNKLNEFQQEIILAVVSNDASMLLNAANMLEEKINELMNGGVV